MSDDSNEMNSDKLRDEAVDQGEQVDQGELDETWRVVRTVGTEEEAMVVVGFLNSSDIPAESESLHISELPVDFGDMSQVHIRVPVERADEAIALLAVQDEAAPVFAEGEATQATEEIDSPEAAELEAAENAVRDLPSSPETK
jgi:hypothetical protein